MKNNIKLFFASLFSNNTAIDAARKKPWYAAVIMFFVSILLAAIPSTVLQLKEKGDTYFSSTSYSTTEAVTMFVEELQKPEYADKMYVVQQDKESLLVSTPFSYDIPDLNFKFEYVTNESVDAEIVLLKEQKVSYFVFTSDKVYIYVLDPNDTSKNVVNLVCTDAYKKVGKDDIKQSFLASSSDATDCANKTWDHWKGLIRKFYNQRRWLVTGAQLLTTTIVNISISLIMGFMIWILTRGKNNPYKLFTVWESFKICFWAGMSPALLTLGLGFLLKNFASYLFPLLLGVRIMWLTMKSLRPDGSGYAAN